MAILFVLLACLRAFAFASEYNNCNPNAKTLCFGLFPDDCVSHKNCIAFAYFKLQSNEVKVHIERRQVNKTVFEGKSYGYYKRSDLSQGIADAGDVWAAVAFSFTDGMDNSFSFDCLKEDDVKAEYSYNTKGYQNVKLQKQLNWKRNAIKSEKSFSCDWTIPAVGKLDDEDFEWDLNANSYYFLMAFGELSQDESDSSEHVGANKKVKHDEKKNFGSFYLSKPDISVLYKSALRVKNDAAPEKTSTAYFTYAIVCIGLVVCVAIIVGVVYSAKRKQSTLLDSSKDAEALPESKNLVLL